MAAKALRRLWKHVHPDLFVRHPEAQAANERSMQSLRALLDAAEECQKALRSGGADFRSIPPMTLLLCVLISCLLFFFFPFFFLVLPIRFSSFI